MADGFLGYGPGYLPVPGFQDGLDRDFLKLPDETQKLLLKKGGDSEKELRREMEELSLKE